MSSIRAVDFSEEEAIERKYSSSIYRNSHLGWFNLWQLKNTGGQIFTDGEVLTATQPVTDNILWLHTFYSYTHPSGHNFAGFLRDMLPPGNYSVYTISSHLWYSQLLKSNGFQLCDEVIQFQTDNLVIKASAKFHASSIMPFGMEAFEEILNSCEMAFPLLWRLGYAEMEYAINNANYRIVFMEGERISGYLMADVTTDDCHILRLAVDPSCQRQGIASALIFRLYQDCSIAGITVFSVNTNKKNSAASAFYKSLNFSLFGDSFPVYHGFFKGHSRVIL